MPAPGKLACLSHDDKCPEHDEFKSKIDIEDIQGDIVTPFPKRAEDFVFFRFKDARAFKKEVMPELYGKISHSKNVLDCRLNIVEHKNAGKEGRLPARFVNIAFTSPGLKELGFSFTGGNELFNNGQEAHATDLGDRMENWRQEFKSQKIHGVILVVAESEDGVKEHHDMIWDIVGKQAEKIYTVEGRARDPPHEHDEHFGWKDGISNPFINGLQHDCQKANGQRVVEPGIIVLEKPSDTVPTWAVNGSFLVFREIDQLVPEFHKFMEEHPVPLKNTDFPGLPDEDLRKKGVALRAAQFVGRWPSGAPLEKYPIEDNDPKATDPDRINDFVFERDDQRKCPFSAHVRKMNPRLRPQDADGHNFDDSSVIRAGITYGPELQPDETNETKRNRGLAFVCYQADIAMGFRVQQMFWANNINFPPGGKDQQAIKGFDPLIGQPQQGQVHQTADTQGVKVSLRAFITTRGGEYFFVPPMTMLRELHKDT